MEKKGNSVIEINQVNHDNHYKLDLYHFGYNMMLTTFKNENIKDGVRNALFLTKMFTQSSDVLLYRKDKTGNYNLYLNALMIRNNRKNNVGWLNTFINKSRHLFENGGVKNIDCADISDDKEITLLPLTVQNYKYVLVIRNCNIYDAYRNKEFIDMLTTNMHIMLDKLENYNKMKKEGNKDKLTGLDNRNAYENVIKELSMNNENFTYVLFDLFRLKYVNDTYDYLLGDTYIIKTAKILKEYFPKYYTYKDSLGIVNKVLTGSCVYRIGGDEFILISREPVINIRAKLKEVQEEVANIELNVSEKLYLGINYGVAVRENNESIKQLAKISDDELKMHKEEMYQKYGIERRKQLIKKTGE